MSIAVQVNSDSLLHRLGWRRSSTLAVVICSYVILWSLTGAHYMGDTNVYAQAILRYQHGIVNPDYRSIGANPFWDFGHVLWRPLGWLCSRITRPVTQLIAHDNERAEVLLTLLGIKALASLGCVVLFFLLARRLIGSEVAAALATVGLFSADAFLNYAHAGTSYIVGLAGLMSGMNALCPDDPADSSWSRASLAGIAFALAVLFWFPYIFVLPAAMFIGFLLHGNGDPQRRLLWRTILICGVVGIGAYSSVLGMLHMRGIADVKQWILASGHGNFQPRGLRGLARLAFSLPRSFVNMGRDGMWLKRYLVHDPYAPVTVAKLLRLSLWKPVLFYSTLAVLILALLRSSRGIYIFLWVASAVIPVLVFAMFIFEAGSIERYLPLYPFVFLAVGYVLSSRRSRLAHCVFICLVLSVFLCVNFKAAYRGSLESRKQDALMRIQPIFPQVGPDDLVLAVNEQDSLAEFRVNFPLDPVNLSSDWRTYDVLEVNTERLSTWRSDLAKRILATWDRGGVVWLPNRFLNQTPKPEWNWVEGDDARIRWRELPAFFSWFQVGPELGDDSFRALKDNRTNRALVESDKLQVGPIGTF